MLIHPTLGVLGVMGALWVFVEAIRIDPGAIQRIKYASLVVAALMFATWFAGGLWDATYFSGDQGMLSQGPWAFVGNTAMETKEHAFVIVLLLALYLPVAAFSNGLMSKPGNRLIVAAVSGLIVLGGLGMEGAGAVLGLSVRVGMSTHMDKGMGTGMGMGD